jgi:hypothetical protein
MEKLISQSHEVLHVGDKLTVAITHEVKINSDNAWIRYEATTTIEDGETVEQAKQRIGGHVTQAVIDVAEQAAAKVMERSS